MKHVRGSKTNRQIIRAGRMKVHNSTPEEMREAHRARMEGFKELREVWEEDTVIEYRVDYKSVIVRTVSVVLFILGIVAFGFAITMFVSAL